MEVLWAVFCGEPDCSSESGRGQCASFLGSLTRPSCTNHAMIICFDALLLAILLGNMIRRSSIRSLWKFHPYHRYAPLEIVSAVISGCLGLIYLCLGTWILTEKLWISQSPFPLHSWVLALLQGLALGLVDVTVSLKGQLLGRDPARLLAILTFLFSGIACFLSFLSAFVQKETSLETPLNLLSLVGASLTLICAYRFEEDYDIVSGGETKKDSPHHLTSFSKAGFLSTLSFWWLNPLMKKGRGKTIEDEDIPDICQEDRAEVCYMRFVEQLNKQKQGGRSSQPSILKAIAYCHWKETLVSGSFALLKILCLSAGPLLLDAFIRVAEGKQNFRHEGYVLAVMLFFSKSVESLSQRQWNFQSRLTGMKVRSTLSAAIYRKQLRLSNAAKLTHSSGKIMNYVMVDAYRIGEFSFWLHQTWTTSLQLFIAVIIMFRAVGLATIAAMLVIFITVLCNVPLAKLQHRFQTRLMSAQDERVKAYSEALMKMKVLKLYAWETHFKGAIHNLRKVEQKWLSALLLRKALSSFLSWSFPVLVSTATFVTCYILGVPLYASNVFTFVAILRSLKNPVKTIPDVISAVCQANVAFTRIVRFLEAPELQSSDVQSRAVKDDMKPSISIRSSCFSWDEDSSKSSPRKMNIEVKTGDKVAICGGVGSGKSTLLAAILGEVPNSEGSIEVHGKLAYVSQTAWIQTGTIRDNILAGSNMETNRYQETLERCSLVKDLEMLPYGDHTVLGDRGVNLSGGQKQRLQLARALYQQADIYLLDDPFSAVDAHTATSLFNEYVMEALSMKTVLLVTNQLNLLPAFDCVLLMSSGEIHLAAPYYQLLATSQSFHDLVHAHKENASSGDVAEVTSSDKHQNIEVDKKKVCSERKHRSPGGNKLIEQEQRETGDIGLKPYIQYLNQKGGFTYFLLAALCHLTFVAGQVAQNSWMAANVGNPSVTKVRLIVVYLSIGFISTIFLLSRSLLTVGMGVQSSKSLFSCSLNSLFHAPMSFYDSTPLGRILSRVSSDMSIIDLDVPFNLVFAVSSIITVCASLGVLAAVTWQVLLITMPLVYLATQLQKYYFASAKELMRINGTTKSSVANHLAESTAGAMTIRAFEEEDRFVAKNFDLIDRNASPFFHNFAADEWLILRLETLSAAILSSSALCMVFLPPGTLSPGFIGMALSYGLSMNTAVVRAIQMQCSIAKNIISVERISQYTCIPSETQELIRENLPQTNWPTVGKVEIQDLQVRYHVHAPLILQGITCTFEGGHKVGIVGRTGSGKSTLVCALFRVVEPTRGKIIVDGIDISKVGLHDLRSRFGIIPQDPTLFNGTVRYNLDPLSQHTDEEIWKVLIKCQLREAVREKEHGLDSSVVEDGSNWSMGQRQLFCLGRVMLKRSRLLVLDEATASIDNATDQIIQRTIRSEFAECTVVTVAHRMDTVMDCTRVLAIEDGKVAEFDEPMELIRKEGSLFGELVKEHSSHSHPNRSN